MKEVFCLKQHNYPTRNRKQNLFYLNPWTVSYGIETCVYKASQRWGNAPNNIQEVKVISTFDRNINYCESISNYIQPLQAACHKFVFIP